MSSYFSALAGAAAAVAVTGVNTAGVIAATTTAIMGKSIARVISERPFTNQQERDDHEKNEVFFTAIAATSAQASQFILTPPSVKGCFFAIGVGQTCLVIATERLFLPMTSPAIRRGKTILFFSGSLVLLNTISIVASKAMGIGDNEDASAFNGTLTGMATAIFVASGIKLYHEWNSI